MNLDGYARQLSTLFNEHMDIYREYGRRTDVGYAAAYRLALSLLHTYTGGEYGTPMGQLDNPHELVRTHE